MNAPNEKLIKFFKSKISDLNRPAQCVIQTIFSVFHLIFMHCVRKVCMKKAAKPDYPLDFNDLIVEMYTLSLCKAIGRELVFFSIKSSLSVMYMARV